MKHSYRIILSLIMVSGSLAINNVQADPIQWGDFQDNGCVGDLAPGMRTYAAILWNIPNGVSWEDTCAATPANILGTKFPNPHVCVNTGLLGPVNFIESTKEYTDAILDWTGEKKPDDMTDSQWLAHLLAEATANNEKEAWAASIAVTAQAQISPWPFPQGNPLYAFVPDNERGTYVEGFSTHLRPRKAVQIRQNNGGQHIWGVFVVPDLSCLPPKYHRLPGPANWDQANAECAKRGMQLCSQGAICRDGKPLPGTVEGDVWMATSDHPNTWVSIGTKFPERICKNHTEVVGNPPEWGMDQGPEPITGEQTAFRCCRE